MQEASWHKIKTASNLILAALVLWVGMVALEYKAELQECEACILAVHKFCYFLNQSDPITPAGRPIEANKSILLGGVDENLSMIMACQEKTRFTNLSEWAECNRILIRPPA